MPYSDRDDITDMVMKQQGASPLSYGLAGLGAAAPAMASPRTGPQLPGLPQTPAGGVPGSGLAPAPPSNMALPPRQPMGAMPQMGAMTSMGTMNDLSAAPPLGMPPPGVSRQKRMF
jgi:hypothetical protein